MIVVLPVQVPLPLVCVLHDAIPQSSEVVHDAALPHDSNVSERLLRDTGDFRQALQCLE